VCSVLPAGILFIIDVWCKDIKLGEGDLEQNHAG